MIKPCWLIVEAGLMPPSASARAANRDEHLARERVVLGVQGADPVEGVDDVGSALQSVQQEVDRLGRLLGCGPMPLDHGRPS